MGIPRGFLKNIAQNGACADGVVDSSGASRPGPALCGLALLFLVAGGCLADPADDELRAQFVSMKRIYVDKLGGGEVANHIRDMLISSLHRTGRFILTENPNRAEAHLRGSAEDLVFTDVFQSSEGISARTAVSMNSGATNSRDRRGFSTSAGLSDNDSTRIQERKHEAAAAVRLVNKDGDVLWSATKESLGAKFRGASADVAQKITDQLLEDLEKARAREPAAVRPSAEPPRQK